MNRSRTQLGTGLLLAVFLTVAAHAGTTAAVVRGVVRDQQGAPQGGALVQLLASDTTAIASAITDLNGRYRIRGVAPGRYQMRASATLFLPALRRNLHFASGAQATVNLTLASLLDTGQWLPPRRRSTTEADDDWKWTLHSVGNRPILRILADGSAELEPSDRQPSSRFADSRIVSGVGNGQFGNAGVHSVFMADRVGRGGSTSMLRADVGAGATPSFDLSAGYAHNLGYFLSTRTAVVYQDHPELAAGQGAGFNSVSMLNAQRMELGDAVAVEVGSLLRAVRSGGVASVAGVQALPFVKVSAQPLEGLVVSYSMATARELQSFSDMDSLRPSVPVCVSVGGQLQMERGRHDELSIAKKLGSGSVQASVYQDRIAVSSLAGGGIPNAVMTQQNQIMLDPLTGTFRILGPAYDSRGLSVSFSEPIASSLRVSGEYETGNALTGATLGDIHPEWSQAGMVAVEGRWTGGTDVRVAYRWQPNATLTAVNSYRPDSDRAYLGVTVRRPLRYRRVLPQGVEAVLDVSNLLAQGYRPVGVSADGSTVFLAQTTRAVQAGLAFTF